MHIIQSFSAALLQQEIMVTLLKTISRQICQAKNFTIAGLPDFIKVFIQKQIRS